MLDFTLDEEQEMLERTIRRFAEERVRPVFRDAEENGSVPREVIRSGWEIGVLPTFLPEQFGGFGEYSAVTGAIAAEAFAWGDLATTLEIMAPNLAAIPILLHGTPQQKERYLPRFCEMSPPHYTAALCEPQIRFDPRQLQTIARRENGDYVLNGVKSLAPLAEGAEQILVYANEGGKTQAFFVPAGTDGMVVEEREQLLGLHALPLYKIRLDSACVPADARLGGEEGIEFEVILNHSRVALGAAAVGMARAAYEYALAYAKQREQFGEPIAHRQSIAFMLAEMAIDVETMRLLVWEAAWKIDEGQPVTREATVMKHYVDTRVLQTADRALQILGGYGYMREYPVELWLRNARGFAHFDGLAIV
ncbi:MAG TPA: acyl-CoA dehydrogenase family protein [Candidatus Binatia bacterium]|nr:acyl-CoA dehydrogenase family protein [Candidatus Binatia bacterium]